MYMPFFDTSNHALCLSEMMNLIAMLEEVIADHPLHHFVIGGDFNTSLHLTVYGKIVS